MCSVSVGVVYSMYCIPFIVHNCAHPACMYMCPPDSNVLHVFSLCPLLSRQPQICWFDRSSSQLVSSTQPITAKRLKSLSELPLLQPPSPPVTAPALLKMVYMHICCTVCVHLLYCCTHTPHPHTTACLVCTRYVLDVACSQAAIIIRAPPHHRERLREPSQCQRCHSGADSLPCHVHKTGTSAVRGHETTEGRSDYVHRGAGVVQVTAVPKYVLCKVQCAWDTVCGVGRGLKV